MTDSQNLLDFLSTADRVVEHKPWPRYRLSRKEWGALVSRLAQAKWDLLGLWAEPKEVHTALLDTVTGDIAVASLPLTGKSFPSLSGVRPSAIRLERWIQESMGLTAEGLTDPRYWLDHGQFPVKHPLLPDGGGKAVASREATAYTFLPIDGKGLHQIPVGPVHAGIIEPGHFRFTCNGETVVRLEERLGYVHKGIEKLMEGKTVPEAAKIAARVSGDSTVAYSVAFARAVEAAQGIKVPARAHVLRGIMAELERVANHVGDFGAVCNDAAFAFMHAQCGILREQIAQAALSCFGHRFMMDGVVPGGVARDLTDEGAALLSALIPRLQKAFRKLVAIYEDTPSLLDRTMTTGIVSAALVQRFAAGGHVGRAASRGFDARKSVAYAPYDKLDFNVPVFPEGDVHARVMVRIREAEASLDLVRRMLATLPTGPVSVAVAPGAGEGMALVEAFRGDILLWVRLDADGRVVRCHPRDASWFQWPLLEASIENNIVADFPLCNKSFNCSYAGHDL